MKRLTLPLACLALATVSFALPPTQAWRRIFNTGSNYEQATGLDVDASGNAYLQYVSQSQGGHWFIHLVKIGAASGIAFDKVIDYTTGHTPGPILVTPLMAGKQYVYQVIYQDATPQTATIYKFDTAGVAQWSPPFVYTSPGAVRVLAMYPDSSGNLLLAMAVAAGSMGALDMVNVNSAGAMASEHGNGNITPMSAFYSTTLNGWIIAGADNADFYYPQQSGRWGVYDPTTGSEGTLGETAEGYASGLSSTAERFVINELPANAFSIAHNSASGGLGGSTYQTFLKVYNSSGTLSWQYPPSIAWGAYTMQVAQLDASAPYFMVSRAPGSSIFTTEPHLIDKFDNTGAFVWQHNHQPADLVFPWNDGGFFTVFYDTVHTTEFLEHADANGVYDYGRGFAGTGNASSAPTFAGFKGFQNSFYFVNNMRNSGTNDDVYVDRFVTGIAMQSISTIFTSVASGNSLNATITLNGNAPAGGVSVGVSSNSDKLLLPNGTRGQYITVPAGQPSVTFALNAQTVTTNTTVRILAIQNIRRFVDVTVTP